MNSVWILTVVTVVAVAIFWLTRNKIRARQVPAALQIGMLLPEFTAVDENGNPVSSASLRGAPAVLLFVRGTWCPFCSKQVANLTKYYKDINDSGSRLILITPKPLETTRRVAEFFEVDFEFWLDEALEIAKRLGLVLNAGVPEKFRGEYGEDSIWPASVVIDGEGVIRHSEISRFIVDRPNPEKLLAVVKRL